MSYGVKKNVCSFPFHPTNEMGSAYMLMYIRESDVARVMQPIRDSNIPKELIARLDNR